MSLKKNNKNYSKIAKFLHWGFVVLFIYGVAKQVDNIEQLEDLSFLKFEIIFALIFFILLVFRFIYMKTTQNSSIPAEASELQKLIAKFVHNSMYFLLAGTVLSGLFIGYLYWLGIKDGLLISISITVHELIINILYFFIGIHIFAAIYHRLKKDGVWNSMVPFLKEK